MISVKESTGWATWLLVGSTTEIANISFPAERMQVPLSLAVGTPVSSLVPLLKCSQMGNSFFPLSTTCNQ